MIKWYAFLPRNIRKRIKTRKVMGAPIFAKMTPLLFECSKISLFRRIQIRNKALQTKTLVLGSSHAKCGWITQDNELNLGVDSQDLYYSYFLYHKYSELMPDLKNIILFYAVFSPGFDVEYTAHFYSAVAHHTYLGIPYHNEDQNIMINFGSFERCIKKNHFSVLKEVEKLSDKYTGESFRKISDSNIKLTAQNHYKNNKRPIQESIYLENMLKEIQQKNQKLFIVIPPFSPVYKSVLPKEKEIFDEIYKMKQNNSNVDILSFYDSDIFSNEDFSDYEHLNENGAEKLSSLVRNLIEK